MYRDNLMAAPASKIFILLLIFHTMHLSLAPPQIGHPVLAAPAAILAACSLKGDIACTV
jgi:hypothetical protein